MHCLEKHVLIASGAVPDQATSCKKLCLQNNDEYGLAYLHRELVVSRGGGVAYGELDLARAPTNKRQYQSSRVLCIEAMIEVMCSNLMHSCFVTPHIQ
jgi:hypothetical protein